MNSHRPYPFVEPKYRLKTLACHASDSYVPGSQYFIPGPHYRPNWLKYAMAFTELSKKIFQLKGTLAPPFLGPMNDNNRPLVTDEPVEFEIQELTKTTILFMRIY